jgi:DNA polymerase III alpha subunit
MYGAVRFYKEAKDAGIKPLVGCEVYVTADRHDRSRAPYYHLTLIARTAAGYRNLMKLSTAAFSRASTTSRGWTWRRSGGTGMASSASPGASRPRFLPGYSRDASTRRGIF